MPRLPQTPETHFVRSKQLFCKARLAQNPTSLPNCKVITQTVTTTFSISQKIEMQARKGLCNWNLLLEKSNKLLGAIRGQELQYKSS